VRFLVDMLLFFLFCEFATSLVVVGVFCFFERNYVYVILYADWGMVYKFFEFSTLSYIVYFLYVIIILRFCLSLHKLCCCYHTCGCVYVDAHTMCLLSGFFFKYTADLFCDRNKKKIIDSFLISYKTKLQKDKIVFCLLIFSFLLSSVWGIFKLCFDILFG